MKRKKISAIIAAAGVCLLGAATLTAGSLTENVPLQPPVEGAEYVPAETMRLMLSRNNTQERQRLLQTTASFTEGNLSMASLSGAKLQGWLSGYDKTATGWYTLDTDGKYKMTWASDLPVPLNLTCGWIKGDRICGLSSMSSGGLVMAYYYTEYDSKTGELLDLKDISGEGKIYLSTYYISAAYVPSEDRIYGYTYATDAGDGFRFCSSPASDIKNITEIKKLDDNVARCLSLCYNAEEDSFFGLTFDNKFVMVDKEGEQSALCKPEVGEIRTDQSAIVYSPLDGAFIYNAVDYSYNSKLYWLYPDLGETRLIAEMPRSCYFTMLLSDDESAYDASAPGRPELVTYGLENGATSGTIIYRLPSVKGDGTTLGGELDWTLYIDNKSVKTGKGIAGNQVTVAVDNIAEGEHVIRFTASVSGKEGVPCVITRYVGNGRPLSPTDVKMTETKVTWNAVTKAELGGYLDLSKIEYDVYVDGKLQGTTSSTELAVNLDAEKEVMAYYADVVAKCNGLESKPTKSNKVIYGAPCKLPYTVIPTQAQAEICTMINADGGPAYGEWAFNADRWHEPVFYSGWSKEKCDDWLILPPVDCSDISHAFRLTIDAVCGGMTGKDERFEVWCGSKPAVEAMNTLILPETQVSEFITAGWSTFTNLFVPKTAGPCYIAVRSVSPPEQYSLLVRNIKIEATDEAADIPMAPEKLELKSTDDKALSATISFKAPSRNISGTEIPADAKLKAVAAVGDVKTEQEVAPGQDVTMTVKTLQGTNRLSVYCELNGQQGQSTSINVFTGTIPPNYVENLEAVMSEDNMSVKLTWSAPVRGQENLEGYYSPEGMHYWLFEIVPDPEYGDAQWTPTKDLGNVTEYTYVLPEGEPLQNKYFGIVAANNGGISQALSYIARQIGKPYGGDVKENFIGQNTVALHYAPLSLSYPSAEYEKSGFLFVVPEDVTPAAWSALIPYSLVIYNDSETGGKARLILPKVATKGVEEPVLTLTLWTSEPSGKLSVSCSTYGSDKKYTKIYDVPQYNDNWKYVFVEIPKEYWDKGWIELALDSEFAGYENVTMIGGWQYSSKADSGIESAETMAGAVIGGRGEIIILGHEGDAVEVYAVDGRLVAKSTATTGEHRVSVAKGIYAVRCGSSKIKVVVR